MTFKEAIASGRPLTRKDKQWHYENTTWYGGGTWTAVAPNTLIEPNFFLEHIRLTPEDILADDWIVQPIFDESDYETVNKS